jgi:hypothetical protein
MEWAVTDELEWAAWVALLIVTDELYWPRTPDLGPAGSGVLDGVVTGGKLNRDEHTRSTSR